MRFFCDFSGIPGKTEFTGFHTRNPVTLKTSLVGDEIHVGQRNVFPEYYPIPLQSFPNIIRDDLDERVWAVKNNAVLDEFIRPRHRCAEGETRLPQDE
uniref:Uncharacterized protein n=1 Tax=Candidatus Kentrum sp. FW TaxID=2126338 RepID=A0A450U2R4_9GAMM|nr:MAG: hypothetical protein BECKFW1821C_GA0114237_112212 [Candidatus Kentron sp. FW]